MVPMLVASNLEESIRFYTEAFGFEVRDQFFEEGKRIWVSLRAGELELMLTDGEERRFEGHADTILYFYPEDVAALHARLQGLAFPISELFVTVYGMKEFRFSDPSGYQVWCGQATDESPSSGAQ
jgi:catechol 2,3-dioxygenase-like lactoylglutathione lyase family enzyme